MVINNRNYTGIIDQLLLGEKMKKFIIILLSLSISSFVIFANDVQLSVGNYDKILTFQGFL